MRFPADVMIRRFSEWLKIRSLVAACRLLGPRFAARFIVSKADFGKPKSGRPTVVALYRPLFSKDLEQLRRRTNLNWVYINNEFLGHVQAAWSPPEMRFQTKYQKFRGERYSATWKMLEAFGSALVAELRKHVQVDAFMTSHIDYWQGEGVRLGAAREGIPFLGLCREHMCLPIEQRTVKDYYSDFKYEGDSIAVFGESTRKIFLESGACRADQVVVTGPPRLDIWRELDLDHSKKDSVVLLSYRDPDYRAPASFREVLALFLNFAQRHPEPGVRYIIKAKNLEDSDEIRAMAGDKASFVQIDHKVALTDLLPRCKVVIGFNSLSLLEAQFCQTTTVIPYWGDARRAGEELMFPPDSPEVSRVVKFPESSEDFQTVLTLALHSDPAQSVAKADRDAVIRSIFYLSDNKTSSQLVEDYVLQSIAGKVGQ